MWAFAIAVVSVRGSGCGSLSVAHRLFDAHQEHGMRRFGFRVECALIDEHRALAGDAGHLCDAPLFEGPRADDYVSVQEVGAAKVIQHADERVAVKAYRVALVL